MYAHFFTNLLSKGDSFAFSAKEDHGLHLVLTISKRSDLAVYCRLSNPDAPPFTQTVLSPVSAYVSPLEKENGKGVWSTFAIVEVHIFPQPQFALLCWQRHGYFCENLGLLLS